MKKLDDAVSYNTLEHKRFKKYNEFRTIANPTLQVKYK
jgi:hypothetical protein